MNWIFNLLFLITLFISCQPARREIANACKKCDSLYVSMDASKGVEKWEEKKITDSITNYYLRYASKNHGYELRRQSLVDIFDLGVFKTSEESKVRLIRFKHTSENHNSIYLFVESDQDSIFSVLELASVFLEEGVNGEKESLIIKGEEVFKVYQKQYRISFTGSEAEVISEIDTLIAYEIRENEIVESSINEHLYQTIEKLFY